MASQSGNLELFETEFLKDFQGINLTAVANYIINNNQSLIITGDSKGVLRVYKREGSKLGESQQIQIGKSKIDKLIAYGEYRVLFILSGGNIYIRSLPDLSDKTPKDSDKESRDLKDIVRIVENECPKNRNELMAITKRKQILFFIYNHETEKLYLKEYRDKDKKQLDIVLKEMPDKIKWYGEHICYYLKQDSKVIFNSIITTNDVSKLIKGQQDIPVEDIAFIQNSWVVVFTGGLCFFFGTDGQNKNKNMISLNQADPFYELAIFNDLYIVSLHEKSIGIYDYNDEKCVQELTTDTSDVSFAKFLTKGDKSIFLISTIKKEEKVTSNLWELREFSFEKQIKLSLKYDQIEKAFGILNNKLEYNMEKFVFLESFYCDCGWNCFKKGSEEGYEEAQKYFNLCNFNPFELMYHFITLLKLKPIHMGFQENLSKEVEECQISGDVEKNPKIRSALKMLIETLKSKKVYLLTTIENEFGEKGREIDLAGEARNKVIVFESSQNCVINLKEVEPKDLTVFDVIKMINEVLVKGMVLLKDNISNIEDIVENDEYNKDTEYCEEFLSKINNFTSDMALSYVYKKNRKYAEALKLLEPYINDLGKAIENKEARNLLQKILIGFGRNSDYTDVFEQGLKILLKNHYHLAFEILLSNELLSVENFLETLNETDKNSKGTSKKELFLKLLCEDKKYSSYSNEKNQTLYIELLLEQLFNEVKKEYVPPPKKKDSKDYEGLPAKYNDFKKLFTKFNKYNKDHLLNLIRDSWMYDIIIFLLTETQQYDDALQKLVELVKSNHKDFDDIHEYCKKNYENDPKIFKRYFNVLKMNYEDEEKANLKPMFKREMLKILELFTSGKLLDEEMKKNKNKLELLNLLNPKDILKLIPDDWKLNEPLDANNKDKTLFNLLRYYLKEYAIINNNYKRLENLCKMDLIYKQLKLHELKDKHVLLDINTSCYLCHKKIQNNTVFLVYPNGHIYHSRCSPDLHIEIKTGRNFENFDY